MMDATAILGFAAMVLLGYALERIVNEGNQTARIVEAAGQTFTRSLRAATTTASATTKPVVGHSDVPAVEGVLDTIRRHEANDPGYYDA